MNKPKQYYFFERWSGLLIITVVSAIPAIIMLLFNPLNEQFQSANGILFIVGKLAGVVGFMLFGFNFILSIRKTWLEDLFGGMNRVYIAHQVTGGLVFIMLLFHPLFLALRYIDFSIVSSLKDAGVFLLPRGLDLTVSMPEILDGLAINAGITAFIGLVGLLFVSFFVKLPYRVWLATHKWLGPVFLVAGLHTLFVMSDIQKIPFLRFYFLAWLVISLLAFGYRSLLANIFVRFSRYEITEVSHSPGGIMHVVMRPVDRPIRFKAGQFIFIKFMYSEALGVNDESHPFSISSAPDERNGLLRLSIKALGDFTVSMSGLRPGTIARIEGAYGRFLPLHYKKYPQIWIAGGVGIAPFLSASRSFDTSFPQIDLFYSVQHREELLDQSVLADYLPTYYPQFSYHPYIFDEQQQFLAAQYIRDHVTNFHDREIFLCGPPLMMKQLRTGLHELGIPNYKIHSEEFTIL